MDKKEDNTQNISVENSSVETINQVMNKGCFFSISSIFGGEKEEDSNRNLMLDRVYQNWITNVLEKSLYNKVMITLGIKKRHNQTRLNSARIWTQQNTNELLPKETKLLEVFDENKNNLLILGNAGSGKTTELINLAKNLIQRAKEDESLPIPIIVNLSSYHKKQSLEKWLINELKTFYGIPKRITKYWLANDQLLLLLDGLDEVKQELRSQCVSQINNFCENTIHSVVVCSRINDYKSLNTKLNFSTQVVLQPLNIEQIQGYLNHVDKNNQYQALRQLINTDTEFQELVNTPFMLNVSVLAYQGKKTEDIKQLNTITEHRNYILDEYIIRTLQIPNEYTEKQNLTWLHNLSSIMYKNSLSVFSFLDVGSKILTKISHKVIYSVSSIFVIYILCLFTLTYNNFQMDILDISTQIICIILSILITLINQSIKLKTLQMFSFKSMVFSIFQLMTILLLFSYILDINGGIIQIIFILGLILFIIIANILMIYLLIFDKDNNFMSFLPNDWAVILILIFLLLVLPLLIKISKQSIGSNSFNNFISVFKSFFLFGVVGGIAHSITYAFSGKVNNTNLVPTIKTHMHAFFVNVFFVFFCFCVIGVFQKRDFNTVITIEMLLMAFYFVFLIYSVDLVKYAVLKTVIKIFNIFPFDIENFLNYSTKNIILRQVGNGYIFIHRLLLEHFASLTNKDIDRLAQEIDKQKTSKQESL